MKNYNQGSLVGNGGITYITIEYKGGYCCAPLLKLAHMYDCDGFSGNAIKGSLAEIKKKCPESDDYDVKLVGTGQYRKPSECNVGQIMKSDNGAIFMLAQKRKGKLVWVGLGATAYMDYNNLLHIKSNYKKNATRDVKGEIMEVVKDV
ncbi:hypothetical protein G168_gp42 [Lactobacillus phage ATCC8014]|uniref:Uncharacterized protein n=1 Tax=Lactobacillus phage ATCC8014 TaxID=2892340 RepID=K4ID09_9CAUD|nr:hypothetical protein G168_gp42 [Lactobacillus phage ATCC8014]AFU63049.1 hypothetical protein 8014-B1_0042 [Lactobacillus phage ATCC8014]